MGGLRLRRLAAAANVSYLVDIRVFLIKGRLRYRSRCGKNLTCRTARYSKLMSAYGSNPTCQLHRTMAAFRGNPEDICSG